MRQSKSIYGMIVITLLLLGLIVIVLTSGCVTKEPVTIHGYNLTHVFEGDNSQAITLTVEGKARAFLNCTTNKRVFDSILLTINDKERHIYSCRGRDRLILSKKAGTYRIEITPIHSMVGIMNATNWRLSIYEK